MRIMLIAPYYYPEVGGTPILYRQLCPCLQSMGHTVTVVTGFPRYNVMESARRYRRKFLVREKIDGVEILRIRTLSLPWHIPTARGLEYIGVAISLFFRALFTSRSDVALVYSPALFIGLSAVALRAFKKTRFVLNVHDLFPQTAIDLGVLRNKMLIRFFRWLESYVYSKADWVTTHSEGNQDWVVEHGGSHERASVMPIWMDTAKLKPGSMNNAWRQKQGLDGKFVVLFAGTQGFNQDIEVILKTADGLRSYQAIQFILVGDGTQHKAMVERSKQMRLPNVRWLDWQPEEQFPMMMHGANVVLATLKKEVTTPVVPSKILSAMSAGRPIVGCMPLDGDAPKLIAEAKAGYILPPGDDISLAETILKLYRNQEFTEQLGVNGRQYVEQYLDVSRWAAAYIQLFSKLIQE